jgi:hypothetical protein
VRRAIEVNPRFTAAHARLAHVHTLLYWSGHDRTPVGLARRKPRWKRRVDPQLAEVHIAAGFYHYMGRSDGDAALKAFAAAERHWQARRWRRRPRARMRAHRISTRHT